MLKTLPFTALLLLLLSFVAEAKLNTQEAPHPAVNPGKVEGYGPFLFTMNASEAFRAASKHKKYVSYEGIKKKCRWTLENYGHVHTIIVHFNDNDTTNHVIVGLENYAKGLMPRRECYSGQFDEFAKEFSTMFSGFISFDTNQIYNNSVEM